MVRIIRLWLTEHENLQYVLCLAVGHTPVLGACGRPEHDICLWCGKPMHGMAHR
jgi:hypothetical protein